MVARVLIVEDNPVARSFLMRVVRDSFIEDIRFAEASDLQTARAALATQGIEGDFRLILSALEIDDGRGLELLPELHRLAALTVATTLHSDHDHLFPALQCGADGYLLKEDRFEILVEELQKIVRGQPPLSPAVARCMVNYFRRSDRDSLAQRTGLPAGTESASSGPVASPTGPQQDRLTPRESEVLGYVSKGYTIKEVARMMNIRWFAVNDHIRSVYEKLATATGGVPSANDEEAVA